MARVNPGEPAIQKALDDVRNEKTPTNWLLTTYENARSSRLKLVGSGKDGWDEMCEELSDGKVYFGFARFTISGVFRYVYLSWCGEGVQGMQAGQFNNHALDMQRFFQGYHVHVNARNDGDIEESDVIQRLSNAIGAKYDAGQVLQGSQGNDGPPQPKTVKKTDPGVIDQAASSKYWESQKESAPSSGYKKDLSFQQGSNASSLKSRFETLAQEQRPNQPSSAAPRKPIQLDTSSGPSEVVSTPSASNYDQGGYDEGATYDTGSYDQGGYAEEATYDAGTYDQGGYDQGGYAEEATYDEGGYDQGGYDQGGYAEEAAYDEGGYAEEAAYDEGGYDQGGELYATALYDYPGEAEGDLPFNAGDSILVIDQSDPSGWWCGRLGDAEGYFPSNFVQLDQ